MEMWRLETDNYKYKYDIYQEDMKKVREMKEWLPFIFKDEYYKIFHRRYYSNRYIDIYGNHSISLSFVQFHYDLACRRVYIFYEISKEARLLCDNFESLVLRLNSRMLNNMYRDFGVYPVILGPNGNGEHTSRFAKQNIAMMYIRPITINTISYWKCFDNYYRFIENDGEQDRLRYEYFLNGGTEEKIIELSREILKINNKYDYLLDNNAAIPAAFDEYNVLYKNAIGKELKVIGDDEITTVRISF